MLSKSFSLYLYFILSGCHTLTAYHFEVFLSFHHWWWSHSLFYYFLCCCCFLFTSLLSLPIYSSVSLCIFLHPSFCTFLYLYHYLSGSLYLSLYRSISVSFSLFFCLSFHLFPLTPSSGNSFSVASTGAKYPSRLLGIRCQARFDKKTLDLSQVCSKKATSM